MSSEAMTGMLQFRCDYCGANPGEWCVTSGGGRSGYLHSARFYAWRDREEPANPVWPR
jgi:hypothetical protein